MQLELVSIWDSLERQHRVYISRDCRNGDYLVEAEVKVHGGIKGAVYRVPEPPTLAEVLALVQACDRPVSPRPYRLSQPCDGTIGSPVLALYARFCNSRGLDPVAIMVEAYPDEVGDWIAEDFLKSTEEADWQGVEYPAFWDSAAFTGLVESLHEVNYHQLAGLIEDLPPVVYPDSLSGDQITRLMRKGKKTIASLAKAMRLSQGRVRHVRQHGVTGKDFVQDWVEAISS